MTKLDISNNYNKKYKIKIFWNIIIYVKDSTN